MEGSASATTGDAWPLGRPTKSNTDSLRICEESPGDRRGGRAEHTRACESGLQAVGPLSLTSRLRITPAYFLAGATLVVAASGVVFFALR